MSAHEDLLAFVNHLFPVGNPNRVRLLNLIEQDRDEYAARLVEKHARPNPLQTRPRAFGGKDLSHAKRQGLA